MSKKVVATDLRKFKVRLGVPCSGRTLVLLSCKSVKSHIHHFAPLYTDDDVLTNLVFPLLMKESELEVNVFRLCGVDPISKISHNHTH